MDFFITEHSCVVVAIFGTLLAVVCWLTVQSYNQLCQVLLALKNDIRETRAEHKADREADHETLAEIFRTLRGHGEELSQIRATCEATQKHCPGIKN